jgi:alpha-L-rhamnosidase
MLNQSIMPSMLLPHDNFIGFRYIEVSYFSGKLKIDSIQGRVVHSAVPWAGEFSCSNELINHIQQNIAWGLRDNFHCIPTDCCQRGERSGWGGDAQVMAEAVCYNFNMSCFYSKWLNDFKDDQRADGGVYDNVPWTGWGGYGTPGWHDCYVTIAMVMYKYYGDTRVLSSFSNVRQGA